LVGSHFVRNQGGWSMIAENKVTTIPLPINFNNTAFRPLITWDDPQQACNASWQFTGGASADKSSLKIGLHTQNNTGSRGVHWFIPGY